MITINVAEADDAEREKRRHQMHEPYRTHPRPLPPRDRPLLLGPADPRTATGSSDFRQLFGDERQDYDQALQQHYEQGAPADWPQSFVSAYASSHPWEDWAETWAHYLHMIDTLETAVDCGLSLRPKRSDEPAMKPDIAVVGRQPPSFDQIIERWFPLTYVLNNLNRGMGLPDAYPFVLPPPAIDKLRFVHEVIGHAVAEGGTAPGHGGLVKECNALSGPDEILIGFPGPRFRRARDVRRRSEPCGKELPWRWVPRSSFSISTRCGVG